ncbi:DsbA family protein [Acinetobacter sp. ANC 4654]|uniref:DsbA family protein n=1 Tax=Acinetobacter sp. ANC 4654 TaxID=1977872 RepID=UPI000A3544B4|nr:DsbA family protein [Acinetobacter sp. ANC 4654]OTG93479.1 DsbA family protein [Acinetobacter sp. ANC 4654]
MASPILHWIIDPICGWSYGALPLMNAVEEKFPNLQSLHLGGLYSENHQPQMTAAMRAQIIHYDEQIHQLTGVNFGDDYKNGLLADTTLIMNSIPATHALLSIYQGLGHSSMLSLLNLIQQGYYQNGLNVTQYSVLAQLILQLGIHDDQWSKYLEAVDQKFMHQSIHQTRQLLSRVRGQGFPTLVYENQSGEMKKIHIDRFYNKPQDFIQFIDQQLLNA